MRKLIVLVGLAMVAVVGIETFYVSDADAGKTNPPPPPKYNALLCSANTDCPGTTGADLMVGSNGNEFLKGAAGNDIYMGSADKDSYSDKSTSSDLYTAFLNGQFSLEDIRDGGGVDRLDLSTNTSAYASTDFRFYKIAFEGVGAQDDLLIQEVAHNTDDSIYVLNHFTGSGRIEYIKFSDKTLSGSNLPLTQ
jgi:hypothetical protein